MNTPLSMSVCEIDDFANVGAVGSTHAPLSQVLMPEAKLGSSSNTELPV